jgi:uncharacterized Zn-binding protein involved in type VI secretion
LAPAVQAGAGAATASPYYSADDTNLGTVSNSGITTVEIDGVKPTDYGNECTDGVVVVTFFTSTFNGSADVQRRPEPFYVIVG